MTSPAPHPAVMTAADWTIESVSRSLRAGERTCTQVLESCLDRIVAFEPEIRAWVVVDRERAVHQAAQCDAEQRAGHWRGPLHGIPIGVKDIVDVAGLPTAAGWPRWRDRVAPCDSTVVARLRAAGAVILGKTVTTQHAGFDPPPTRNPWNPARTPGGSSSGSAAALACGMCLGAVGSQTGGSITRPASFCGVAGCKPSFDRISRTGVLPFAPSLDHVGPMARCVGDLAILLDAMADPAPSVPDPHTGAPTGTRPVRLARLRGIFDERADASMSAALECFLDRLTQAGAVVEEIPSPLGFEEVLGHHRVIMAAEAAATHLEQARQYPDDYLPRIRELIDEGARVPATRYLAALDHKKRWTQAITGSWPSIDAWVCPATLGPAPDTQTTGDPAFNSPWSYSGLPAVSFPVATSADGLPLAVQLIGPPSSEDHLFRIARWCERHANSHASRRCQ